MCDRFDAIRRGATRCALLATLLLGGCGGAAAVDTPLDAGPDPTTVLLFRDGFDDEETSAERWTPSQPDLHVDESTGTLPLHEGDVTTNAPPFVRAGGELELTVAMWWPTWCPGSGPQTSRPIQLVELDSGLVVASLVVTTTADCATLLAEYRIDPAGSITTSSVVNPVVTTPSGFADGFHEYRIVLLDDGRATWYRDGAAMITSLVPLSDGGYALRLEGSGSAGEASILFDEVVVRQR